MNEWDFTAAQRRTEAWVTEHDLVGLSEEELVALADPEQILVRVVARDGTGLIITADFRPNRVNVELAGGRVSRVHSVG